MHCLHQVQTLAEPLKCFRFSKGIYIYLLQTLQVYDMSVELQQVYNLQDPVSMEILLTEVSHVMCDSGY